MDLKEKRLPIKSRKKNKAQIIDRKNRSKYSQNSRYPIPLGGEVSFRLFNFNLENEISIDTCLHIFQIAKLQITDHYIRYTVEEKNKTQKRNQRNKK